MKRLFTALAIRTLNPELRRRRSLRVTSSALRNSVLVILLNVKTRLRPRRANNVLRITITRRSVIIIRQFTATNRRAITRTMNTILSRSITIEAIIRLILVYPESLTSLRYSNVIVSQRMTSLSVRVNACISVSDITAKDLRKNS